MIRTFIRALVTAVVDGWKDGWNEPIDALDGSVPPRTTSTSTWWSTAANTSRPPRSTQQDPFTCCYDHWGITTGLAAAGGAADASSDGWWNSIGGSNQITEDSETEAAEWYWDNNEIYDYDGDLIVLSLISALFISTYAVTFARVDFPFHIKKFMEQEQYL